jgi:hypothetical protein
VCTLVILRNRIAGHPLVLGANRDEYRDRPWEPPRRDGAIVAPRDLRAGGTWLAVADSGLVVAVTNRPGHGDDPARPSRGTIAMDAARAGSVAAARDLLRGELSRQRRNGFRVLIADAAEAWVVNHPGEGGAWGREDPVPDGFHTVTNLRRLDALDHAGALDGLDLPTGTALDDAVARIGAALGTHAPDPPHRICKHQPHRGTLSSAIVAVPESGAPPRFWFAPGPPCETPYEPVMASGA